MIANCGRAKLAPIIRKKVFPASVVFSKSCGGFDALSVEGCIHEKINHDHEIIDSKVCHMQWHREFFGARPKGLAQVQRSFPKRLSIVPSIVHVAIQFEGARQRIVFLRRFMRR